MSEVLGLAALAIFLIELRGNGPRPAAGLSKLALLAGLVALSAAINLAREAPVVGHPGYPHGYTFDIIEYALYGLFVIAIASRLATHLGHDKLGQALGLAIRLAFLFCIFQMVAYLTGATGAVTAVDGVFQLGRSYGVPLPRNGPFMEGNYFGLFAGAAVIVCARRGDRIGVLTGFACLAYSQSTSALLALACAWLVSTLVTPRGKIVTAGTLILIVAGLAVLFIPAAGSLADVQMAKLGAAQIEDASAQEYTFSRDGRLSGIEAGYRMSLANPILGVGPGRFGLYNDTIRDEHGRVIAYTGPDSRGIANNGFAQIAAEEGIVAWVVVVGLFLSLAVGLRRGAPADFALAVFLLVAFNTAPAWTLLPAWIIVAYLMSAAGALEAGPHPARSSTSEAIGPARTSMPSTASRTAPVRT